MTAPMTAPPIETLLHPLGVRELLDDHWERRAVHLPGPPDRFAGLGVDRRAFASAAAASYLRSGIARLEAQYLDAEGRHREIGVPAPQIDDLYAAGMTLCLSQIDDDVPAVARLAASVKEALGLAGNVFCNAHLSPPGRGSGMHLDSQSVFILQLEGSKEWIHGETPAHDAPVQSVLAEPRSIAEFHAENPTASLALPDLSTLVHQRLQPGDVLYVPPGCWHQTFADGPSPSLSLSLTCTSRNFTELISDRLFRVFRAHPDWRRNLPAMPPADIPAGALPEALERFFAARLAELRAEIDALDPRRLVHQWLGYLTPPRRDPPAAPASATDPASAPAPADPAEIAPADRFRVRRPLRFGIDVHGADDTLFVHVPGLDVVLLPPDTLPFVRELAAREAFTAEDAINWTGDGEAFAWEDVREALHVLLETGLILREPAAP
jgi:hypothetical protein